MLFCSIFLQNPIYQKTPVDAPLPWDFLDNRVKKEFLAKEFIKSRQEKNPRPAL